MCVKVTKTANRFDISSLLEKILLKQVRWWLTFVGLYIYIFIKGTVTHSCVDTRGSIYNYTWYCLILNDQF